MADLLAPRAWMLVALMLAACTPGVPVRPATSPAARGSAPIEARAASPTPKPVPLPAARKLRRPPGDVQVLAGTVALDGGFLAATGQGSLASSDGIISDHAAGLVSNNGGGIISDHAAGVVAIAGAFKLAGGAVVANNGGNIIAEADGNVVAGAAAAPYGLLAAPDPVPAAGQLTVAAGMRVGVVELATGKPVPLGLDPEGQPVTAVYSNARGGFELYVPSALAGNVRVEVGLPEAQDDRFALELLTALTREASVDEDTSLISRLLRLAFTNQFANLMDAVLIERKPSHEVTASVVAAADVNQVSGQLFDVFFDTIRERGAGKAWTPAKTHAIAARVADRALGHIDLAGVTTLPPDVRPLIPLLVGMMRETRQQAARTLEREPEFFKTHSPYKEAGATIARAGDLSVFITNTYFTRLNYQTNHLPASIFTDLGFTPEQAQAKLAIEDASYLAISAAFLKVFAAEPSVMEELLGGLDAGG